MDPNATLKEIREIVEAHLRGEEIDIDELVNIFHELDVWLQKGGFLPLLWKRVQ